MLRSILALAFGAALQGAAVASITAVPPASMPATPVAPKAQSTLLAPDAPVSHKVVLPAPSDAELARFSEKRTVAKSSGKPRSKRLPIGFGRTLPGAENAIRLASLEWHNVDGWRVAHVTVTSPTAAALRIALSLASVPKGAVVRFAGTDAQATTPFDAQRFAGEAQWSPVLEGDTATIELAVPLDADLDDATLSLPQLSHLIVSQSALKQADPLRAIGTSGSCEVDVVCLDPALQQQAASAINATARIVLTDAGSTFLCTGTLLNNSSGSTTPYFYTANHCIDDDDNDVAASRGRPAGVTKTFQTYWFFRTSTCNVHTSTAVNFTLLSGGATLLARSVDYDWTLTRLDQPAPAGATFSAWNSAGPLATGTPVLGLHHPAGDLEKASQGATQPYDTYSDLSSFIAVRWSQGVTEPGSSGSGLFTLNPSGNFYELRGGLFGGDSACRQQSGIDDYSRMDVAIPLLAEYLTPTVTAKTVTAVEFYNVALDDYFITANANEISDLDSGVHPGWVRTGFRFLVYTDPAQAPADAQPVCRFYVAPAFGDSHFYSADPAECASTAQRFANQWVFESSAVFYIQLPNKTTGTCPSGTRPVFRFLNNANGLHHRYTAEVDVRDSTIDDGGWTLEGYGNPPNQVVMCSPNQ